MPTEREDRLMQEKGKALLRALHLSELAVAGKERDLALHKAEEQLDRIARLLPDALEGGISISEIARVTGISRPTLYELRARYGGAVGDLRLAILQAVIAGNAMTVEQLAERLTRPSAEIKLIVDNFIDQELLEEDVEQIGEETYEMRLSVTMKGLAFLEHWQFEVEDEEDVEP